MNRKHSGYQKLTPDLRRSLTEEFRDDIQYLAREGQPGFQAWAAELT